MSTLNTYISALTLKLKGFERFVQKANLKRKLLCFGLMFFGCLLLGSHSAFSQTAQELKTEAELKLANENTYTIPSITELRRRLKPVADAINASPPKTPTYTELNNLQNAINNLKGSNMPYNIVMNINGDTKTRMAFNWFTNAGVTGGKVQIVQGAVSSHDAFSNPMEFFPTNNVYPQISLNYNINSNTVEGTRNNLLVVANIPNKTTKSYTENKVLATGLSPGTTYSFRIGGVGGAWSEIGTFTTDQNTPSSFTFLYTTDPQAYSYESFVYPQTTSRTAHRSFPNAKFWITCGDLVDTEEKDETPAASSEWEWEQFFETQQDIFYKLPFAPVLGNHDFAPVCNNFSRHFNTERVSLNGTNVTNQGSIYSFVYGDVHFIALNFEEQMSSESSYSTYLQSLANWMDVEFKKYPTIRWRIVYFHTDIYTGSTHMTDNQAKYLRSYIAPVLDTHNVDIAFQGHDHIYEVIGPVKNKQLVAGAVTGQTNPPASHPSNVTGKKGGIYNTNTGTLYFLNGCAGEKLHYSPKTLSQLTATSISDATGVTNYYSLFTGLLAQPQYPTYSSVNVSTNEIVITTYRIMNGTESVYDEIKVVKPVSSAPNANLSALSVGGETLSPPFSPGNTNYTVYVPNSVPNITISATPEVGTANVTGTGIKTLTSMNNLFPVVVTNGSSTKTYNITVKRAPNSNANLSALNVNQGTLSPSFNYATTSYNVSVPYSVTSIDVTATPTDANATLQAMKPIRLIMK